MRLRLHCSKETAYYTQEAVLSQRAAKCGLHNSVKPYQPVFTGIGVEFVLRHPGGVDLTVTERFS